VPVLRGQTSSNILRYTPAQLAIGALDEADGEVVVPGALASYLAATAHRST
jgi:hypothetical protein